MKKPYAVMLVTFFIFTFASVGFASAQTATISATGQAFWATTPSLGAVVDVTINFQSSSDLELSLYRIGIHADWQQEGYYYSKTFSSDPPIIQANGLYAVTVPISIPINTTLGQHTLIISADGYTSDGDTFNWDSATQTFTVQATAATASPTSNQNQNNNTTSPGLDMTIILGAVIAVVAVVVVLLLVLLMKRRGKAPAAPAAPSYSPAPEPVSSPSPKQAPPQQQPEDNGSEDRPEEKDFNI